MSEKMLRNLYLCLDEDSYEYGVHAFRNPKDFVDVTDIDKFLEFSKNILINENYENCYLLITTSKGIMSFKLDSSEILPNINVTFPEPLYKKFSRLRIQRKF